MKGDNCMNNINAVTEQSAVKVWTKSEISSLLYSNDKMVVRSLIKLYNYQTEEEKAEEMTKEDNGVGFNAIDAEILSNIAEQVIKTKRLTFKQLELVRRKIMKYAGQLTKIANNQI